MRVWKGRRGRLSVSLVVQAAIDPYMNISRPRAVFEQRQSQETPSIMQGCQAVVFAGSGGQALAPLNSSGAVKVLLPITNRPLLTFPLRTLDDAGILDVIIVSCQPRLVQQNPAGSNGRPRSVCTATHPPMCAGV